MKSPVNIVNQTKSGLRINIFILITLTFLFCPFNAATAQKHDHSARDRWQQPERIMDSLGIKQGMIIGEAGAGEGYFTFKLSRRIGLEGIVYANDILPGKLQTIKERCQEDSIDNIITLPGKVDDPLFPVGRLDMIIMVYVFHELEEPVSFLNNASRGLKPGAPIVIVERDPAKFGGRDGHFLEEGEVTGRVKAAGFEISKIFRFLPRDNIYLLKGGEPDKSGGPAKQ
jgi:ubiquinone/menaquinone biosynthesis C-methylase UbiE